jgi:hypothetical protein
MRFKLFHVRKRHAKRTSRSRARDESEAVAPVSVRSRPVPAKVLGQTEIDSRRRMPVEGRKVVTGRRMTPATVVKQQYKEKK